MYLGKPLSVGAVLFAALLLGTGGRGDPAPPAASPAETYYVIGVAPSNAEVKVATGDIKDGKFGPSRHFSSWSNTQSVEPEDGYIFVKVAGEPTLGITIVRLQNDPWAIYSPCEKAGVSGGLMGALFKPSHPAHNTIVFTPPAGRVTYIGDVTFNREAASSSTGQESVLQPQYGNDLERARAFLRTHHPEFANRLEQGSYALMPAADWCF